MWNDWPEVDGHLSCPTCGKLFLPPENSKQVRKLENHYAWHSRPVTPRGPKPDKVPAIQPRKGGLKRTLSRLPPIDIDEKELMDRKTLIQVDWFGDHVVMHEDDQNCEHNGFHTVSFRNTRQDTEIELKISCLSRHSMFGKRCTWYDRYAEGLNRKPQVARKTL